VPSSPFEDDVTTPPSFRPFFEKEFIFRHFLPHMFWSHLYLDNGGVWSWFFFSCRSFAPDPFFLPFFLREILPSCIRGSPRIPMLPGLISDLFSFLLRTTFLQSFSFHNQHFPPFLTIPDRLLDAQMQVDTLLPLPFPRAENRIPFPPVKGMFNLFPPSPTPGSFLLPRPLIESKAHRGRPFFFPPASVRFFLLPHWSR